MHIKIEKGIFDKIIGKMQGITSKKSSMPILSNILIDAQKNNILTLKATDLEIGSIVFTKANVVSSGACLVSAKSLHDIVRELPPTNEVELIKKENNWVQILSGKIQFNIVGLDPQEYPKIPKFSYKESLRLKASVFYEMIDKTLFAASTNPSRTNLNGCLLERLKDTSILRVVSTDGHRLALIDREIDNIGDFEIPKGVILPRKGLLELKKLLEDEETIEISFDQNHFIVKGETSVMVMRLIDGEFPDYNRVIPKQNDKCIKITRDHFIHGLRRCMVVTSDFGEKLKYVKMNLQPQQLEITTKSSVFGDAREEIAVDYEGDNLNIGFNATYFLDALNSTVDDNVFLYLEHDLSPALLSFNDSKDYINVIMPVRV